MAILPISASDADRLEAACMARAEVLQKAGLADDAKAYLEIAVRVRRTHDSQQRVLVVGPPDRTKQQHGRWRTFCLAHDRWAAAACTEACDTLRVPVCDACEDAPRSCASCKERA